MIPCVHVSPLINSEMKVYHTYVAHLPVAALALVLYHTTFDVNTLQYIRSSPVRYSGFVHSLPHQEQGESRPRSPGESRPRSPGESRPRLPGESRPDCNIPAGGYKS